MIIINVFKITYYDESGKHSDAILFLTLTEPFRNELRLTKYSIEQPEQKSTEMYFLESF